MTSVISTLNLQRDRKIRRENVKFNWFERKNIHWKMRLVWWPQKSSSRTIALAQRQSGSLGKILEETTVTAVFVLLVDYVPKFRLKWPLCRVLRQIFHNMFTQNSLSISGKKLKWVSKDNKQRLNFKEINEKKPWVGSFYPSYYKYYLSMKIKRWKI